MATSNWSLRVIPRADYCRTEAEIALTIAGDLIVAQPIAVKEMVPPDVLARQVVLAKYQSLQCVTTAVRESPSRYRCAKQAETGFVVSFAILRASIARNLCLIWSLLSSTGPQTCT